MKPKPFDLRKLFRVFFHRSSLYSSSYSLETNLNQSTKSETPFLQSSQSDEPLIKISSRDSKLRESVDHLCKQKRLKDVIQLLENQVSAPSVALYSTILQLCIDKRALDEGKRVQAHIKRLGFVAGILISNKILDLYCKCGNVWDARKLYPPWLFWHVKD